MLSAYLAFALAAVFPGQPVIVVPVTLGVAALRGALTYRLVIRRMHGRPVFASVLLTVALGIAIEGLVVLVWTPRVQYPAEVLAVTDRPIPLPFGGVVSTLGLPGIGACGAVLLGLAAFFRFWHRHAHARRRRASAPARPTRCRRPRAAGHGVGDRRGQRRAGRHTVLAREPPRGRDRGDRPEVLPRCSGWRPRQPGRRPARRIARRACRSRRDPVRPPN